MAKTKGVVPSPRKTRALTPEDRGELGYALLAQSPASNALAHVLTAKIADPAQLDMYGTGRIDTKDFRLFIKGYSDLQNGVSTSAAKLLDCLLITATADGLRDALVRLPLRDYMRMRDLKNEKETRAQIKRDMDALQRIRFEYKGKGRRRGDWINIHLYGGTSAITNSVIYFRFNEDVYDSLRVSGDKYLFMYLPHVALRLNDKYHPHSYFLARRIAEHKRMNAGKPNENIIGVHTLIDACPTLTLYEEADGDVTRRIIEPFERDLDALKESFQWHYTGDQPAAYQDFLQSNVQIQWNGYPDLRRLMEKRASIHRRLRTAKAFFSLPKTGKRRRFSPEERA